MAHILTNQNITDILQTGAGLGLLVYEINEEAETFTLIDPEDGTEDTATFDQMRKVWDELQEMPIITPLQENIQKARDYLETEGELYFGDLDAIDCDCWAQMAAFGTVVYG